MGELLQEPYRDVPEMLPGGESMANYAARVGSARVYHQALAAYRARLADERGITLDELHDASLTPAPETAGQESPDGLDLKIQH